MTAGLGRTFSVLCVEGMWVLRPHKMLQCSPLEWIVPIGLKAVLSGWWSNHHGMLKVEQIVWTVNLLEIWNTDLEVESQKSLHKNSTNIQWCITLQVTRQRSLLLTSWLTVEPCQWSNQTGVWSSGSRWCHHSCNTTKRRCSEMWPVSLSRVWLSAAAKFNADILLFYNTILCYYTLNTTI